MHEISAKVTKFSLYKFCKWLKNLQNLRPAKIKHSTVYITAGVEQDFATFFPDKAVLFIGHLGDTKCIFERILFSNLGWSVNFKYIKRGVFI